MKKSVENKVVKRGGQITAWNYKMNYKAILFDPNNMPFGLSTLNILLFLQTDVKKKSLLQKLTVIISKFE